MSTTTGTAEDTPERHNQQRGTSWKIIALEFIPLTTAMAPKRNVVVGLSYLLVLWVFGARLLVFLGL